jgi:prevent-host-death family protein
MVKSVYGSRLRSEIGKGSGFRLRDGSDPVHGSTSREFQTAEDIIPIAELKANMSEIVRGLDARPRPLVITLNGKPAAVVMSPREYDLLAYRKRFLEAVYEGLADTEAGQTYDGEEVVAELMTELKPKKPHKARR